MVSASTVNSNMNSFTTSLNSYSSQISNLGSSWRGDSYTNLVNESNSFIQEYKVIQNQFSSFASACSTYEKYVNTKDRLSIARSNLAIAEQNKDSGAVSRYSAEVSQLETELASLKSQIESYLSQASSPSLAASTSTATVSTSTLSSNATVQKAIDFALAIAADDSHGYSQKKRWGNPDYDCSSLVISAWEAAGIPVKSVYGAGYTGNMKRAFLDSGMFTWIEGDPNPNDLQPGDILLTPNSHTEIYLGNGKMVGARHGNKDNRDGDSSGTEISVTDYDRHWTGVLRYTGGNTVSV